MQDQDLDIFVTVTNIHRIDDLANSNELIVELEGTEIAPEALEILQSDRTLTRVRIILPAAELPPESSVRMGVGSRLEGRGSLGILDFDLSLIHI